MTPYLKNMYWFASSIYFHYSTSSNLTLLAEPESSDASRNTDCLIYH